MKKLIIALAAASALTAASPAMAVPQYRHIIGQSCDEMGQIAAQIMIQHQSGMPDSELREMFLGPWLTEYQRAGLKVLVSRTLAEPVYHSSEKMAEAIEEFAWQIRDACHRPN